MAGTTTTTADASDLMRLLEEQVYDQVYYHGEGDQVHLMNLFLVEPVRGGESLSMGIKVAANGSFETFSEGQDVPVAGQGLLVRGTQPWTYFRTIAEISGHAEDAAAGTQLGGEIIRGELDDAMRALTSGVKTAFLANSTIGLVGLVDDATTSFYGLSRSTYPALASYVADGGSAALSLATLNTVRENVHDAPYLANADVIVSRPNIKNDYLALAPQAAAGGTTPVNVNRADVAGSRAIDLGWRWDGVSWDGIPWLSMTDLAATVVLGLRLDTFSYVPHRDFSVKVLGDVRDSHVIQYSHAGALKCTRPRSNWKIEALA